MKLSELPHGKVESALFRIIQKMGDLGNDAQALVDKINTDESFVKRVAKLVITGGYEPSISHQRAREIMGKNFFGIEESVKHFEVNPTKSQLAYLDEIPFSEEVLTACKDTHVLVAVFPVSIVDIRSKTKKCEEKPFYGDYWYDNQGFAQDRGAVGWNLVRKTPVVNSIDKNWRAQLKLLSQEEEVPKAQVMVYMIIGYYLTTGEHLFDTADVRCVDIACSDEGKVEGVLVGKEHAKNQLGISGWHFGPDKTIGIASARKSQ